MDHFVVTIAREYGAGGSSIASLLAEQLGVPYYERKLLRMASDVSGINESLFGEVDERLGKHELIRAANKVYVGEVLPPDSDNFTSTQNLFNFQAKIIKELAETSSCIIVGRCADFLLSDKPYVLRVFLHASLENRVARMAAYTPTLSEADIVRQIKTEDKRRAEYYKYYTNDDWRDAAHYDISIDSGKLGDEGCVEIIKKAIPLFTKA